MASMSPVTIQPRVVRLLFRSEAIVSSATVTIVINELKKMLPMRKRS